MSQELDLSKYMVSAKDNYHPGKIDRMLIISRPGVGKTSSLMDLPDCIYFDLEKSSAHFKGNATVIDIRAIAEKEKWGPVSTMRKMTEFVKSQGKKHRFCVIDTISMIDDWAEGLALVNYKQTPMGKTSDINNIFDLPHGGGYNFHRQAFQEIIEWFEGIAETLILVAHIKDSSIKKNGDNATVVDIRLTGALREIISAKQDASCILSFDKDEPNIRYLDFRKSEENVFMKCRVEHLSGLVIPISEKGEDGKIKTFWHKVFLDLKK